MYTHPYSNARLGGDDVSARVIVAPDFGAAEDTYGAVAHLGGGEYVLTYTISTMIVVQGGFTSVHVTVNGTALGGSPFLPFLLLTNPPVGTGARFTPLARSIEVTFDQDTDRGGAIGSQVCHARIR